MAILQVSEAELTSLNQQKKIEELEAQLQEAEEIVRDLRAELRETQAELENVTKHQMHPPVEQNTGAEIEAQEIFLQENRQQRDNSEELFGQRCLKCLTLTISMESQAKHE